MARKELSGIERGPFDIFRFLQKDAQRPGLFVATLTLLTFDASTTGNLVSTTHDSFTCWQLANEQIWTNLNSFKRFHQVSKQSLPCRSGTKSLLRLRLFCVPSENQFDNPRALARSQFCFFAQLIVKRRILRCFYHFLLLVTRDKAERENAKQITSETMCTLHAHFFQFCCAPKAS